MSTNNYDYIKRKSDIVQELFSLNCSKGMSESELIKFQQDKIIEMLNINNYFFNDIIIEGKNIYDHYSEIKEDKYKHTEESFLFFKILSNANILKKIKLLPEHVISLSENLTKHIRNNNIQETENFVKFFSKIIFKYWEQDISYIKNNNFKGGNVCSHFISNGISTYNILKNEIDKIKINKNNYKKFGLDVFKEEYISEKDTFSKLFLHLTYSDFSLNMNINNELVKDNMNITTEDSDLANIVSESFYLAQEEHYNGKINIVKDKKNNTKKRI